MVAAAPVGVEGIDLGVIVSVGGSAVKVAVSVGTKVFVGMEVSVDGRVAEAVEVSVAGSGWKGVEVAVELGSTVIKLNAGCTPTAVGWAGAHAWSNKMPVATTRPRVLSMNAARLEIFFYF